MPKPISTPFHNWACAAVIAVVVASCMTLSVHAQAGCTSAIETVPLPEEIVQTIQLAPPIAEQSGNLKPVGRFYQQSAVVNIPLGSPVWLSSRADGLAAMCTDDIGNLFINSTGQRWQHDFRSADHNQIVPIAPVEVTHLFVPGNNIVTLTLTDSQDPAYSSNAYYLLVLAPIATEPPTMASSPTTLPPATATSTDTPAPTSTATPSPTATVTHTATQTPAATASSTPTPWPTATPSFTPSPTQVILSIPTEAPSASLAPLGQLPLYPIAAAVLMGIMLVAVGWRVWQQPRLSGELAVYRGSQYVGTYQLNGLKQAVGIDGQGQLIPSNQGMETAVIRILPRGKGRDVEVVAEQVVGGMVQETYILEHGDDIRAGELRLHYEKFEQQQEEELNDEELQYELSNRETTK